MRLKFTSQSLQDLQRLKDFIASKNPIAAQKYIDQLLKVIRQLVVQPEPGKEISAGSSIRQLIAGNYIVRYTLREKTIYILKIWHSKEDR